jgi:hypothetical protein
VYYLGDKRTVGYFWTKNCDHGKKEKSWDRLDNICAL